MTQQKKDLPDPSAQSTNSTPMDKPTQPEGDPLRMLEEAVIRVRELTEDLLERDRTVVDLRKQVDALRESEIDRDRKFHTLNTALVTLENTLIEYREKITLQLSELTRQQEITEGLLTSLSWRLTAPVRRVGAAVRGLRRRRARSTEPLAAGKPTSIQPAVTVVLPNAIPADRISIIEQAFQQMRKRTGIDAWEGYVHRASDIVESKNLEIKAIAFYVPEFYSLRGEEDSSDSVVTPWTNISESLPRYLGHYQPHLPGELGFYDQRLPEILRQQVDLARQYGIYGFCFHFYWSHGMQLKGRPIRQFLSDASLDIKFCICWMNEDRSRDQSESENISRDSEMDEAAIMDSLEGIFSDPRYIRIDGKPLLIVHRPAILPDAVATGRRWRSRVKQMGFPDLYIIASRAVESADPRPFEFDASVEYPPHETAAEEITTECSLIDPDFSGRVYSYRSVLEEHIKRPEPPFANFRTVMTSWDDESRHHASGTSFAGSTPALYARWLDHCCRITMLRRPEERLLFINGWNNWADGAHLEPDRKFGYAYLQASANVLRQYQNDGPTRSLIESINATFVPSSRTAIIFHCHYEDLIAPLIERQLPKMGGADLFVTVHPDISRAAIEQISNGSSSIYFLRQENRGRDIRPFLYALRHIRSLGYLTACKIHTKKTPQAENGFGDSWRERLIDSLLGSAKSLTRVVELFSSEPTLGILAPKGSITDLSLPTNCSPNTFWLDRLLVRMNRSDLIGNYAFRFPAGSMFWFRVEALAGLDDFILAEDSFEQELGQRDGTLAHAVERLVALYARERGFSMKEISDNGER